jgi:hypothetical protein
METTKVQVSSGHQTGPVVHRTSLPENHTVKSGRPDTPAHFTREACKLAQWPSASDPVSDALDFGYWEEAALEIFL